MSFPSPRLSTVLPRLAVSACQLSAALLALGPPDPKSLAAFLAGAVPTEEGAEAMLRLILWALVLGASLAGLRAARASASRLVRAPWPERLWGMSVLFAGFCVLAGAALHRWSGGHMTMAGGSLLEAEAQLAR
jgi:hypothetical protein